MGNASKSHFIEPKTYKKYVRNRFLEIAAIVKPEVFRELAGKPFELLQLARMNEALSPIFEPDFCWTDFESGAVSLSLERINFRDALISWQKENYLLETKESEKWLLRWLVESGIDFWARIIAGEDSNLELPEVKNFEGETTIFRRVDSPSDLPSLPAYKPPAFLIYDHFQDIHQTEQNLSEYIEAVKLDFEKRLETFRREMKSYIAKNGGWQQESGNLLRDLFWTAQSQLNDAAYSQLAGAATVQLSEEIIEKYKDADVIPLTEINKNNLNFTDVEPSSVQRAVEKTLKMLTLEPRPKERGRRRGNRQNEIDSQTMI